MDISKFINEIIENTFSNINIDPSLEIFARESIARTIPETAFTERMNYFSHSFIRDKKPTLEISIHTPDNYLYDFTYDNDYRMITSMKLDQDTYILLEEYFQESENGLNTKIINIPYKVELTITNSSGELQYEVEGERKVIKDLILYGQKIIQARHSINKGREK